MSGKVPAQPRRPGRARRVVLFLLTFAVSLAVGRAFEIVSSREALLTASQWQQRWYQTVVAMAPLALARAYVADVLHLAGGGDFDDRSRRIAATLPKAPPLMDADTGHGCAASTAGDAPPMSTPATSEPAPVARDETCRRLLMGMNCDLFADDVGTCLENRDRQAAAFEDQCAGWTDPFLREGPAPTYEPPASDSDRGVGHVIAAPLAGLLLAWQRLTFEGGWSYVWAILQLGAGFLAWLFVHAALFAEPTQRSLWPEGVWAWVLGVPIGTVLGASVLAFAMKYLMLGGLAAFGWLTCFAAAACVATGLAGLCWYLVVRLAEHAASNAASIGGAGS